MKLYLIAFILLTLQACNKEGIQPDISGDYTGIFERGKSSSTIELSLNNGMFSGGGGKDRLPAICRGNYSITENVIQFQNECFFTAEFDWSLILNGKWNYTFRRDKLILTNVSGDKYTLTKK